jgi:hypothetical protein
VKGEYIAHADLQCACTLHSGIGRFDGAPDAQQVLNGKDAYCYDFEPVELGRPPELEPCHGFENHGNDADTNQADQGKVDDATAAVAQVRRFEQSIQDLSQRATDTRFVFDCRCRYLVHMLDLSRKVLAPRFRSGADPTFSVTARHEQS